MIRVKQMGLSEPSFFTENLGKVVRLGNIADKGAMLFYNEKYGGHLTVCKGRPIHKDCGY